MKAVVTGTIGCLPVGGVAWDYGQYAVGLERLGFDVFYLEDTGFHPYDRERQQYVEEPDGVVRFLPEALTRLSPALGQRWHYRHHDGQTFGLDRSDVADVLAEADLFLNVSGIALLRDEYLVSPRKVLIDTDPGLNHFARFPASEDAARRGGWNSVWAHDHFFTYAERLGAPDCPLPSFGLDWHKTRPPVVLDEWHTEEPPGDAWTTVLSWGNYEKGIQHEGRTYGAKEVEFEKIEELPASVDTTLEIAIGGRFPPVERLREHGWRTVDSTDVSRTLDDYRHYITSSRGEFSVAKNAYVETRCGWFSCRSVCYLAAGRPVVVQDTGWTEKLPHGEGLLAFSDFEEAVSSIKEVERDLDHHAHAARAIAVEHFDAQHVLTDMLNKVGLS